jgi:hypothetical protein
MVTSLVGAAKDQLDHQPGLVSPRVSQWLLINRSVSRLSQERQTAMASS